MQQVRNRELPARREDHVPRAHAGGVPRGERGADHAAHVRALSKPREDAGFSQGGRELVRAGLAGLRARKRQLDDAVRHGPGHGFAHGGQPALDPGATRQDRHLPRVHSGF